MHRCPLALAVVAVLAFAPAGARANANGHTAMRAVPRVDRQHQHQCFVGGPPLQIGAYDPQRVTPIRTTVAWHFRCDGGESVPNLTVESTEANGAALTMTNDRGDVLTYELCPDPACTPPQGNLNAAVHLGPDATDGTIVGTILLYALVPALQAVSAGSYHGVLTITFGY
jgi:spore coat protein U-like protein